MKYECDCIKNMECVKFYENCIQSEKNDITLLLPTMFGWIDKRMNDSDEVWRRMHQK